MEPITLLALGGALYLWAKKKGPARRASNITGQLRVAADCNSWEIDEPGWYIGYAVPRWNQLAAVVPAALTGEKRIDWLTENILLNQTHGCTVARGKPMTDAMQGLFDHIAEYIRTAPPGGNPFYPDLAENARIADMFEHKGYAVLIVWVREGGATGMTTGTFFSTVMRIGDANAALEAVARGETEDDLERFESKVLWQGAGGSDIRMARAAAVQAIDAGHLKEPTRNPPHGGHHGGHGHHGHHGGWRGGRGGRGRGWGPARPAWGGGWGGWNGGWAAYYENYPCPPDKTPVLTTDGVIVCATPER